jgi:hypothetical protein
LRIDRRAVEPPPNASLKKLTSSSEGFARSTLQATIAPSAGTFEVPPLPPALVWKAVTVLTPRHCLAAG